MNILKCTIYIVLIISVMLLITCDKKTDPVSPNLEIQYDYNKIEIKQRGILPFKFEIGAKNDLILPSQLVKKIVFTQSDDNEVLFSEEIPYEYSKVGDQYQLKFLYSQRSYSEKDTLYFNLTFESEKEVLYSIDNSFVFIHNLTEEDFEIFFRFEALGENFQNSRIGTFDLRDNSLVFIDYSPSKLYQYDFNTLQTECLLTMPDNPIHIASNNDFTFITIDNHGLFRYNHNTDTLDIQIDLSQLEYDIGERFLSFGMNIFRDSLFVIYYDQDLQNQKIAKFDLNGNYFGSFDVDEGFGPIGGLAQYENLIFSSGDTSFFVWNRFLNISDLPFYFYSPPYGYRGGDYRIYEDYFYFIDNDNTLIARVKMDKIMAVIF